MTRVVYVNGRYAPYAEAAIHVEDRGFQFADGVYEVCEVRDGRLVDERRHMSRPQPLASRNRNDRADELEIARRDFAGNHSPQPGK